MDITYSNKNSCKQFPKQALSSIWAHPEHKPLDFKVFGERLLEESGIQIERWKMLSLQMRHTSRVRKGYSGIVCDGLLYVDLIRLIQSNLDGSSQYEKVGHVLSWVECQAALCGHPASVMQTVEFARRALLDLSDDDEDAEARFRGLERDWLTKAANEEHWYAGYLLEEECMSVIFRARLRLAEIHRATPKEKHYIELAREMCNDSEDGAQRYEILEEKVKELASSTLSTRTLTVCRREFSEQESSGERDEKLLKRYSVLRQPLPLAQLRRSPEEMKRRLNFKYPWLVNATQHFIEQLQMQLLMGQSTIALRPTLLVGEPGIGKNHYLHTLAKMLSVPCQLISVGGSSDNRALAGTARGYSNGRPSQILTTIAEHRVANPLIVLDEIEKEGKGNQNGRMTDTLHQLLEKGNARYWYDEFLLATCDLSWVNWIACANSTKGLSDSLLSRFEVIRLARPAKDDLFAVVHGTLRDVAARFNQSVAMLPELTPACWDCLEDCMRKGYSPREIARTTERLISAVMHAESKVLTH